MLREMSTWGEEGGGGGRGRRVASCLFWHNTPHLNYFLHLLVGNGAFPLGHIRASTATPAPSLERSWQTGRSYLQKRQPNHKNNKNNKNKKITSDEIKFEKSKSGNAGDGIVTGGRCETLGWPVHSKWSQ